MVGTASLTFTGLELWLSNLSETEKADLAQKSDIDHFYTGPDTLGGTLVVKYNFLRFSYSVPL